MRFGSVQCVSVAVAQKRCPWASFFVPVPGGVVGGFWRAGGFLCFVSASAFVAWSRGGPGRRPGRLAAPAIWGCSSLYPSGSPVVPKRLRQGRAAL
jgi:hypothetical protein